MPVGQASKQFRVASVGLSRLTHALLEHFCTERGTNAQEIRKQVGLLLTLRSSDALVDQLRFGVNEALQVLRNRPRYVSLYVIGSLRRIFFVFDFCPKASEGHPVKFGKFIIGKKA